MNIIEKNVFLECSLVSIPQPSFEFKYFADGLVRKMKEGANK